MLLIDLGDDFMRFNFFNYRKNRSKSYNRLPEIVNELKSYEKSKKFNDDYYTLLIEGANIIKKEHVNKEYVKFISIRMINFLVNSNGKVPDSMKDELAKEISYYKKLVGD